MSEVTIATRSRGFIRISGILTHYYIVKLGVIRFIYIADLRRTVNFSLAKNFCVGL